MIEFTEKQPTSIEIPKPVAPDYNTVRLFLENFFFKKDLDLGFILSYPVLSTDQYIDILFLIIKENIEQSTELNNKLLAIKTDLKVIFKDNKNLEKFLTMIMGSIIKVVHEYKTHNKNTNKS
jgi:hypothetical protein